jgi:ketosteroid isomerase-like protein
MRLLPNAVICLALSTLAGPGAAGPSRQELQKQVADSERAFAATMKARDFAGFGSFVAEEAVFFTDEGPLRGRAAITTAWKKYYEGREAPFSWRPEQVEVLESGTLAYSGGPVYDPQGKLIAHFGSIWRKEAKGGWKIVFDRGEPVCECRK